jgi:23S rRNA (cytosine1962-C5)-methyltransferase
MFLDQRENRLLVRRYAQGAKVLDCFAYTGGFSCNALAAGAVSALSVDSSVKALAAARENRKLNGFVSPDSDFCEADVFTFLRECKDTCSLIIVDPPKFAKHDRDVEKACRGYKDVNLLAIRKCLKGGVVFTFSCSQAIDPKLFRQVVFSAAADSGREVQILHVLSQPPDHPVNASHREGEYLKGLVLRVL